MTIGAFTASVIGRRTDLAPSGGILQVRAALVYQPSRHSPELPGLSAVPSRPKPADQPAVSVRSRAPEASAHQKKTTIAHMAEYSVR